MPRARSSPPKSVKFRGQPCPISFNNFKETDHAEMVPGRGIAARNGGRHRAGDRPIDPRRARTARRSGFGRGHRGKRQSEDSQVGKDGDSASNQRGAPYYSKKKKK